jgi:outer membrane biogenesis lipoprotein LolB
MSSTGRLLLGLASLALLSGCSRTLPRVVTADELCQDWQHKTVSKNDKLTQDTAAGIEADNKRRPAWGCAYGKNEAGKS